MEFVIADNQAVFHVGRVKVITRLIDGQFPDYRRALPTEGMAPVKVKRSELLAAVERASLISAKRGMSLIKVEVGQETMVINAQEAEVGKVHEELPISGDGAGSAASFQTYYVMDVLRALDSDTIIFDVGDGIRQGCLRPADDAKYTYVLMPVRVG